MSTAKLNEAQRKWFEASLENTIDLSVVTIARLEKELSMHRRQRKGPFHARAIEALEPRIEGERAFLEWLIAGRAALRGES